MPTPNFIKYSTTPDDKSIKVGNYSIGVASGTTYGPTSGTSYWSGISPPTSGYTIYENKVTNGPSIRVPSSSAVLIDYANRLYSGSSITTEAGALTYFNSLNTVICANINYEEIVTSGLTLLLDAGFTPSYPKSGTSWTDLSFSGNNGTLINGPTFNSANSGSIVFDGSNDYVNLPNGLLSGTGDFTIIQWVQCNGPGIGTTFGNYPSGDLQFGWSNSYVFLYLGNSSAYASNSNFTTAITMITGRRIGTTTNYLKNGTVISTGSSNASIGGSNSNFRIGTNTSTGEQYNGKIFTTMVYNRGLSNAEILQNYNAQKSRFGL